MRHLVLAAFVGALATLTSPMAAAGTDVGVSISLAQPGAFGRIDIGNVAPPPSYLIQQQPVWVTPYRGPAVVRPAPVYMHVPPAHSGNWKRYCHQYNACGTPVYFVNNAYAERHWHGDHHPDRHGNGHGHGRDHDGHRH